MVQKSTDAFKSISAVAVADTLALSIVTYAPFPDDVIWGVSCKAEVEVSGLSPGFEHAVVTLPIFPHVCARRWGRHVFVKFVQRAKVHVDNRIGVLLVSTVEECCDFFD